MMNRREREIVIFLEIVWASDSGIVDWELLLYRSFRRIKKILWALILSNKKVETELDFGSERLALPKNQKIFISIMQFMLILGTRSEIDFPKFDCQWGLSLSLSLRLSDILT